MWDTYRLFLNLPTVSFNPLLSLWEIKNENQIFNCRFIKDLSIYLPTEWLKSRFLVKVLCYNHPRLFSAESDKRELQRFASKWSTPLPNPPLSSGTVPDRAGGVNVLHSVEICCNSKLTSQNSQQFSPFSHAVGESITASQQPQPNSRIPGLQPRLYAAGEAGKPSEQPTDQSQQSKTQVTPQPAPNIPQGDKI